MSPNTLTQKAQECIGMDVAGSFMRARYRLEELDPKYRDTFLLIFESLMRAKIQSIIDEELSTLVEDMNLFRSKTNPLPKKTFPDKILLWIHQKTKEISP